MPGAVNESTSSLRRMATAERDGQIWELRKQGYDFPRIAKTLGCSLSTCHRGMDRVIMSLRTPESAHGQLELELGRLDGLWVVAMAIVTGDDLDRRLAAIGRCLQISHRRAGLLGLDAPVRHTVTVIEESLLDAEIARLERDLASAGREDHAPSRAEAGQSPS